MRWPWSSFLPQDNIRVCALSETEEPPGTLEVHWQTARTCTLLIGRYSGSRVLVKFQIIMGADRWRHTAVFTLDRPLPECLSRNHRLWITQQGCRAHGSNLCRYAGYCHQAIFQRTLMKKNSVLNSYPKHYVPLKFQCSVTLYTAHFPDYQGYLRQSVV